MNTRRIDPNVAVLEALGIPHKDQGLKEVTIRLRAGELPSVHVVRLILDKHLHSITEQHQRFTLTPADPQAERFDLEAACQQAMKRLTQHIEERCRSAKTVTHMHFFRARERLQQGAAA